MKADLQERGQDYWRRMRPIVKAVLPRGVRMRHLAVLDAHAQREPLPRLALMAATSIASGYMEQVVAGFDLYRTLAQTALLVFCIVGALRSLAPAQMIPICSVLGGLTLRNA